MATATKTLIRYEKGMSFGVKAPVAHAELERIREANGGVLRPRDVVNESKDEAAPLHGEFTWDDAKAANKCREDEARSLIRSIRVISPDHPQSAPQPVYLHVGSEGRQQQGYLTTATVLSDAEMRRRLVAEAHAALQGWLKRFGMLEELAAVAAAAEKTLGAA